MIHDVAPLDVLGELPPLDGIPKNLLKVPLGELWGSMSMRDQAQCLGLTQDDVPFNLDSAEKARKAFLAAGPNEDDSDSVAKPDEDEDARGSTALVKGDKGFVPPDTDKDPIPF